MIGGGGGSGGALRVPSRASPSERLGASAGGKLKRGASGAAMSGSPLTISAAACRCACACVSLLSSVMACCRLIETCGMDASPQRGLAPVHVETYITLFDTQI